MKHALAFFVALLALPCAGQDWRELGSGIVEEAGDQIGIQFSMSHDGRRVAVVGESSTYTYVSVYEFGNEGWNQIGSDLQQPSGFTANVALSGDGNRLVIGARNKAGNATEADAGEVRVYEYSNGNWGNWEERLLVRTRLVRFVMFR